MDALQRAIDLAGSQVALADMLDVEPGAVTNWKRRGVPVEQAIAIEKALQGAVTRHELRPDIFEKSRMSAQCPVCDGALLISGEAVEQGGQRKVYYWCPACSAPRDPAGPESGQDTPVIPTGEGEGNMTTNRRFGEDRTQHGIRETHGRDQGSSAGRHR